MNDDSLQETAHVIVQRDIAQAEATTTGDNQDTEMSVPQPEIGPASTKVPTKLHSNVDVTTQIFDSSYGIEVTDGNWKHLPVWACGTIDGTTIGWKDIYSYAEMTFDQLLGVPLAGKHSTESTAASSKITYNQNGIAKFNIGRLKESHVKLGNFTVTIERDSSGGVQMKDEPIFEVQITPLKTLKRGQYGDYPAYPSTTYLSTLKEGLTASFSVDSGLLHIHELVKRITVTGSPTRYWYQNMRDWLLNEEPAGVIPEDTLPARPQLNSPIYHYWIRMVNVPRGLSNIKIYLNYTCELQSHWYCTQYLEDLLPIFPYYGTVVPQAIQSKTFADISMNDVLTPNYTSELWQIQTSATARPGSQSGPPRGGGKRTATERDMASIGADIAQEYRYRQVS